MEYYRVIIEYYRAIIESKPRRVQREGRLLRKNMPKSPFATPVERFLVQNQHVRRLCIGFWSKMHHFHETITLCDACRALLGLHVHEKVSFAVICRQVAPVNLYSKEPESNLNGNVRRQRTFPLATTIHGKTRVNKVLRSTS